MDIKFFDHIEHPFTYEDPVKHISAQLTDKEKNISYAALIVGLFCGIVMAPVFFFSASYLYKKRHIEQLKKANLSSTDSKVDSTSQTITPNTPSPAFKALTKVKIEGKGEIRYQNSGFYLTGDKLIDLNHIQNFLLNDLRQLSPDEQITACNEFQALFALLEKTWNENKPGQTNDAISLWKNELDAIKRIATQKGEAKKAFLLAKSQAKKEPPKSIPFMEIQPKENHPIRQIIPLRNLLGPEGEYKNVDAAIYKNIQQLTLDESLAQAQFAGIRGDGHCTLRAFAAGLLYNCAFMGGEAKVREVLQKLGLDPTQIQQILEGVSQEAPEAAKKLLQNFSEKQIDLILISALRNNIADHFQKQYKTDDSIAIRVKNAAIEKLGSGDFDTISDKDIETWLHSFRNPSDAELSKSYVFATDVDLCTLCKSLELDMSYYSVSNVLSSREKRDQNGESIIEKVSTMPATTSDGTPILEKTAEGMNSPNRANQTRVQYATEKVPSYTVRHFHNGKESDKASPHAICIFNRGGAHSDLLIKV